MTFLGMLRHRISVTPFMMLKERFFPYLWYPLGMSAALGMLVHLATLQIPAVLKVYIPIAAVAIAILWLQRRFPERRSWQPRCQVIRTDLTFMALVQLALPEALAVALAFAITGKSQLGAKTPFWPQSWPLVVQIGSMLLAVDFGRYW